MTDKILEILNKGGVHIPTFSDFREIAKHTYEGKASDFTAEWLAIQIAVIMQRFEGLVRGKLINEPDYTDFPDGSITGDYSITGSTILRAIDEGTMKYKQVWQPALLKKEMLEGESAWFEYRTLNELPTAIELALSYGEIWKFIKSQDNGNDKWKFTESFVNQLIKP